MNLDDQKAVDSFLANERNGYTHARKKMQLAFFYAWLQDHYPAIQTILDVDPFQFREYLQFVEQTVHAGITPKTKYRTALYQYIKWIIGPKLAAREQIQYNYDVIFDPNYITFTDTGTHYDDIPLTKTDIVNCLAFFRARNERDYLLFSILAYTGMRAGGVCNIRIDNVNFDTRSIKTQEKRTSHSTGMNTYAIPKTFMNTLKAFILQQTQIFPTEPRLFPITPKAVRIQIKRWRKDAHPHLFRDALNTIWMDMGLDQAIRSMLLNQVPTGVNAQNYLKKYRSWPARLELYDRFFPF